MKACRILSALFFFSLSLYCQTPQLPKPVKPTVVLLGTIHDMHFRPEFHYSLADLRKQVEQLQPEVICGEITPEAYQGAMEGYFPPEAAYLSEIAPALNARFVPVDWRIASAWQSRAATMVPEEKQKERAEMEKKQLEGVMNFRGVSLFDYLHSPAFLGLSDHKFEQVIGESTVSDIAAGGWHERNRKIVENCLESSEGAQRIVIAVGANHIPQLRRQLDARGITAQVATRQFTPGEGGSVPPTVLLRWNKNLRNLKGILGGSIKVSQDSLHKVKGSHRVQDLELAIKSYGSASSD